MFPSVNERFVFCSSFRFPGCKDDLFSFSRWAEPCKELPNRMTTKSWSFGGSGWAFDGLNVRESVFKPEGSWMEWSTRWASIVGNQCCVVHLGIIMIPLLLALMSFNMAASTRLNGGNAYFTRSPTDIKSIHCIAVWVWHRRHICLSICWDGW